MSESIHDPLRRLDAFAATIRQRFDATSVSVSLEAGSVRVLPGGRVFSTITAALDSITDAGEENPYIVLVGAGTYAEEVTCKPWVILRGAGADQTSIEWYGPTVTGASSSAIQACAVRMKTGAGFNAVDCVHAADFQIQDCVIHALDSSHLQPICALAIDFHGGVGGSRVSVVNTTLTAEGGNVPTGLIASRDSFVQVVGSRIVASGGAFPGNGGVADLRSTILVDRSYAEGARYCLSIVTNSVIVATGSTLNGPIGPGVQVKN